MLALLFQQPGDQKGGVILIGPQGLCGAGIDQRMGRVGVLTQRHGNGVEHLGQAFLGAGDAVERHRFACRKPEAQLCQFGIWFANKAGVQKRQGFCVALQLR